MTWQEYEAGVEDRLKVVVGIERKRVNWVLDADTRGFFDNVDHEWMLRFLQHRIADRRILRLIQKWLKDGDWSETKVGTPPGVERPDRAVRVES